MGAIMSVVSIALTIASLFSGPEEDPVLEAVNEGFDKTFDKLDRLNAKLADSTEQIVAHIYNADFVSHENVINTYYTRVEQYKAEIDEIKYVTNN